MPKPGDLPGTRAKITQGIVSVDPPSIAAGESGDVDVEVPYLNVGEKVVVNCLGALEAGLVPQGASVPTTGSLRIRLHNPSAAAVDGAELSWLWRAVKD